MILWDHPLEQSNELFLPLVGRGPLVDNVPRMALQGRGELFEPFDGEVALAELKVADLLAGGSDLRREPDERKSSSLTERF